MRKLTPLIALALALAVAGGSSALGASGVAVNPGDLSFGRVATGDSPTQQEQITNGSGSDAVIALDTGGNGAFSIVNDSCTGTLPDGQNCTFGVQYNPSSTGSDSSTLTVDEGAAGTDTFALSGTGVANRFIFTNQPGNPDFGNVAVGDTSGSKQITITNNTDYPDNPNVHLGGSDPGQFSESDDCTSNVASPCTAMVSFQPTSQGGKSANLLIDRRLVQFSGTASTSSTSARSRSRSATSASNTSQPGPADHRDQPPQPRRSTSSQQRELRRTTTSTSCDCAGGRTAGQSCLINVVFSAERHRHPAGHPDGAGPGRSLSGTRHTTRSVGEPRLHRVREPAGLHLVGLRTSPSRTTVTRTCIFSHRRSPEQPAQFTLSDNCFSSVHRCARRPMHHERRSSSPRLSGSQSATLK